MIERIILESTSVDGSLAYVWIPAEHISRSEWQSIAEEVIGRIRKRLETPAFGLTSADVSVHYHRPLQDFAKMLRRRLGA